MLQPVMSPPMSMQAESLQPAQRRSSIEIAKSKTSKPKDNKSSSSASSSSKHSVRHISAALKNVVRGAITGRETKTTTDGPRASTRHPVDRRDNYTRCGRPCCSTDSTADEGAARILAKEAVAEESAAFVAQRVESLRAEAIFSSSSMDIGRLRELAGYEGVSLNPRSIRFEGRDYSLTIDLVARLSGGQRDDDDEKNASVFLGRDRFLYVFEHHNLNPKMRKIDLLEEEPFSG